MRCIVYRGRQGLLLVPDCMRASVEAERDYGPLLRCGEIETDRLDPLLVQVIDEALDRDAYAVGDASLALRLAYQAADVLPLPDEFEWRMHELRGDGIGSSVVHAPTGTVVADVHPAPSEWGWHVATNTHRPWQFRGAHVGASQAVAMQYLALWIGEHAADLRRTAARVSAAGEPAPSAPP